jgi:energy-coupling factor transporter ATP-binding protein EcfA2
MAGRKTRKQKQPGTEKPAVLRRLQIHQLRHVAPCELTFSDTYNVLLGVNATGKTTLLEVISAALSFNFAKMKKEAFFIEYDLEAGGGTLHVTVRNKEVLPSQPAGGARAEMEALAGQLAGSNKPSYKSSIELLFSSAGGKRLMAAHVDELGAEVEVGDVKTNFDSPRSDALYIPYFLIHLLVGIPDLTEDLGRMGSSMTAAWPHVQRFDEALGFFRNVTDASARLSIIKTERKPSTYYMSRGRLIPESVYVETRGQVSDWGASNEPVLTMTGEHVGLLAQIAKMLGFAKVELRFAHLETAMKAQGEVRIYGDPRFMLHRADGSVIPHTLLSYGQKRALAFLYYLALNPRAVIADELVDGLHHLWIVDCIAAIGDRQAFLASQNPLLLDYLEFDSADKVCQSFIQCRLEKDAKGGEQMRWSNLSEYDAARFYDAYQVGLQHVSEILRTKGLW